METLIWIYLKFKTCESFLDGFFRAIDKNPYSIDPLYIVGMQPIWGAKQMKFSLLGIEILLFCPPDWLHSHRRARGPLTVRMARTCLMGGLRQYIWWPRSHASHSNICSASPFLLHRRQRALRTDLLQVTD